MRSESICAYSDGVRLTGDWCFPSSGGLECPTVVCCQGLGSGRTENRQIQLAEQLCANGVSVVLFDYRGWGDSEGERGQVIPWEQVRDIRALVSYVLARQGGASKAVGLAGASFGGANALVAAAVDSRIAAVSAAMPFGDGEAWMRSIRSYEDWRTWLKSLESNALAYSHAGVPRLVKLEDIVVGGQSERVRFGVKRASCMVWQSTGVEILSFKPEDYIGRIAPRPLLLLHGTEDCVIPVEQSLRLKERAGDGARLHLLEGCGHFSMYHDWFDDYSQAVCEFHRRALFG